MGALRGNVARCKCLSSDGHDSHMRIICGHCGHHLDVRALFSLDQRRADAAAAADGRGSAQAHVHPKLFGGAQKVLRNAGTIIPHNSQMVAQLALRSAGADARGMGPGEDGGEASLVER